MKNSPGINIVQGNIPEKQEVEKVHQYNTVYPTKDHLFNRINSRSLFDNIMKVCTNISPYPEHATKFMILSSQIK